ncbi:MAG: hypothetical protein V1784_09665 [bacterium]
MNEAREYTPSYEERHAPEVVRLADRAKVDLEISVHDCRPVIAWMLHESGAPEMKAALEAVVIAIGTNPDWADAIIRDKAEAALAKARGEG